MIKIILCVGQKGERVSLRHQQQAMIKQSSEDATAAGSTAKKNLVPTSAEQHVKKNLAPTSAEQPAKNKLVASTEKSTMKRSAIRQRIKPLLTIHQLLLF